MTAEFHIWPGARRVGKQRWGALRIYTIGSGPRPMAIGPRVAYECQHPDHADESKAKECGRAALATLVEAGWASMSKNENDYRHQDIGWAVVTW